MAERAADEAQRIESYFGNASWRPTDGALFLVAERRALTEKLVSKLGVPIERLSVCDVGCGDGGDLERWAALGVPEERLTGTELVRDRAEHARRAVPGATITRVRGFELPFADASFDLVTASLVVSSVLDAAGRRALVAEMWRTTRPGGLLAIYDFRIRKPWNRHVAAVTTGELARILTEPTRTHRLAPFLPALNLALRLPGPLRGAVIAVLPRTHRLWVWRRPE